MDFTPTEAQRDLAGLTRDIVARYSTVEVQRQRDSDPTSIDRTLWNALHSAGLLAASVPADIGGDGFGLLETASIALELGRGLAAVPFVSTVAAAAALDRFGTTATHRKWAIDAVDGTSVLALALDEEHGDAHDPLTRAERIDDGWAVRGAKTVVDAAPIADAFLVTTTDGVFVLGASERGITVTPQRGVDTRSLGMVDIDCIAAESARLDDPDATRWILARATVLTCAYQVGVLEESVRLTAEYARRREQFGKPIGSFQAVAGRLADAYIDVRAARSSMWKAAWSLSDGRPSDDDVDVAKFWASDAGHRVAHTLVHVHGGVGLDREHPVHRYFLAAKRAEFAYGSATARLLRLGASLAAVPV